MGKGTWTSQPKGLGFGRGDRALGITSPAQSWGYGERKKGAGHVARTCGDIPSSKWRP